MPLLALVEKYMGEGGGKTDRVVRDLRPGGAYRHPGPSPQRV